MDDATTDLHQYVRLQFYLILREDADKCKMMSYPGRQDGMLIQNFGGFSLLHIESRSTVRGSRRGFIKREYTRHKPAAIHTLNHSHTNAGKPAVLASEHSAEAWITGG